MKTAFTLITFFFTGFILNAQPVVTSTWGSTLGYTYQDFAFSTFPEFVPEFTNAGPNLTWNFTGYAGGEISLTSVIAPGEQPFLDSFLPSSSLYYYEATGAYAAFTLNGNIYQFLGTYTPYNNIYFDSIPQTEFRFPVTYFDSFVSISARKYYPVTGNIVYNSLEAYEVDSFFTKVDGYGTLITPGGTFNNVMRVAAYGRRHLYPTPSNLEQSIPDSILTWISAEFPGVVLCQISYGSVFPLEWTGSYAAQITTLVKDVTALTSNVSLYPQPASNKVNMNISGGSEGNELKFSITDISGKEVISGDQNLIGNTHHFTLDVSILPSGLYLANVMVNGQQMIQKLSIVHY